VELFANGCNIHIYLYTNRSIFVGRFFYEMASIEDASRKSLSDKPLTSWVVNATFTLL
jgi:hypothetical protein